MSDRYVIVVNPRSNRSGWYAGVSVNDLQYQWLLPTHTRGGSLRRARRWVARHKRLAQRQQYREQVQS